MDFIYLLRILLKRKWIILGAALSAGIVAWYFTRNEEKKYRSSAQISTGFTISDEIKVGNDNNFSFYEADTKFNNAIVTFLSPRVINLLSYTLILHDLENPHPFTWLKEQDKKSPLYKEVNPSYAATEFSDNLESMNMLSSFNPEQKKLLEYLNLYGYDYNSLTKNLNIYRVQRTDYIQIEYTSGNPELSAFVVNTIFQQFLRYYNTVRSRKSQESIDTLRSLMEKKKQELDSKNSLLRGEEPSNLASENTHKLDIISNLEKTLTDERTKQTTHYYDLRKVNQRLADMGVGTQGTTAPPDNNNSETLILRKAMNDAYAAYVNGGSSDKSLLAKYNSLKTQYQTKIINSGSPEATDDKNADPEGKKNALIEQRNDLSLDIQASASNISDLEGRISQLKGNAQQDASKGVAIETLMKDADQSNKEYLAAKQKYNEAMDITNSSLSNFRQILLGQPAIEPEPSKKLLVIAMASIGVLLTTMVIIVLLAYFDASVKTPVIFGKTVNLKLISMVNFMNLKQKNLAELVAAPDLNYDPKDKERHNVFRESLRKLRYEIEISGKKIFLFTSTKKGEGKTTLIQALSFSMSLSKKKVLIIDTNFCNNDLTLALDAAPILEKIVPNDRSDEALLEQIRNLSKDVGMNSVYIIGSKGGDYTPSEILPRKNLLHHLQALTAEYDYIFLEGPPLNDFSDSKELVQYVDGVIAVFSANHIIKQIDKESMSFFRTLNGKFTGSILNMVDLEMVNVT